MEAFKVFLIVQCLAAPSLGTDVDRIVGGDEADIKSVPYIGALLKMGQNWCGASLINYNTAVTAAHCVVGLHESQLSLRVGSSYYYKGGQEISIKQVITHEKYVSYDRGSMNYDVAILKLVESVKVQDAIPIPLAPAGRQYLPGTIGVVAGWGDVTSVGPDSETLRMVDVPVVEQSKCQKEYRKVNLRITPQQLCAGFKRGGKDSCHGDSGGPYVINGELAGIVSFGLYCADPSFPSVYMSVPAIGDWIRQHAGLNWFN